MKIIQCVQGEAEWHQARVGRVTASEADALLTPEFNIRTGAGVQTYLYQKVAEAYAGKPMPGFSTFETEQGQMLEIDARRWYKFTYDELLLDAGFIVHDDGRCGCSPDALIGDYSGLEIKSPQPTNQVRYFLEGVVPKDYIVQVHFSMYVTGLKTWRFVSYARSYPKLVLTVERDEKICATIAEALAGFYAKMDAALERLGYSPNAGDERLREREETP